MSNTGRRAFSQLVPSNDGQSLVVNYYDSDHNYITAEYVCPIIKVTNIERNLDDNSSIITLSYTDGGEQIEFDTPLTSINSKDIINLLLSNSLIIMDCYANPITQYLLYCISSFKKEGIRHYHSKLGFHHNNKYGEYAFFSNRTLNTNVVSSLKDNDKELFGEHGNFSDYMKMIDKEVIPNINLQLAFSLGFIAPLVPLLMDKTSVGTIASNFSGVSSSGKTTSLILMASIWGKGVISNDGIIKSFYATNNALINNLKNKVGYPVFLDDYECGTTTTESLTSLLYAIAQGASKGMGNIDGTNRPSTSWNTFIALSGETSIFERVQKKMGLLHRIIEFNDFAWTSSKENAENIKTTCLKHYGFLGNMFVEKLAKLGKEKIESVYDKAYGMISDKLEHSNRHRSPN